MFNNKRIEALENKVKELEALLQERTTFLKGYEKVERPLSFLGFRIIERRVPIKDILSDRIIKLEMLAANLGYEFKDVSTTTKIEPAKWVKIKGDKK